MPDHPLRKLLSGVVLGEDLARIEIAYIHRGALEDIQKIKASEITRVGKGSFVVSDGETQIPFHRILYIRDERNGQLLWRKRNPPKTSTRDL